MGNKGSKYNWKSTTIDVLEGKNLSGRYIIVTGASGGIGEETARALYSANATVIMASRSLEKLKEAQERILSRGSSQGQLFIEELDLSSLESIDNFAKNYQSKYNKLHVLINNAAQVVYRYQTTKDGFEQQFGTNHFGPFSLTLKLLDCMKKTAEQDGIEGRIVTVSSSLYSMGTIDLDDIDYKNKSYSSGHVYINTKLANILFTVELAKRLKESNVNVVAHAIHPGMIKTELGKEDKPWYVAVFTTLIGLYTYKTIEQGAATQVYAAISDDLTGQTGLYLNNSNVDNLKPKGNDFETAAKLFKLSEERTGIVYPF